MQLHPPQHHNQSAAADNSAGVFTLTRGHAPLLISMPHVGTQLSPGLAERLQPAALSLADTDWHLPLLYQFFTELGATCLVAHYSRYVIDLNRPPDNASLYPGQSTTGLCPVDAFDGSALYQDGQAPSAAEIATRLERYWQPYHHALDQELQRLRGLHARVVLWDAHSIASLVPRFFAGRLPDLNLGTADGHSCDAALTDALQCLCAQTAFSHVTNGRFKGGYITRHYGQVAQGIHAVQMEMAQSCYMREGPPWAWDAALAQPAQAALRQLLLACRDFASAP